MKKSNYPVSKPMCIFPPGYLLSLKTEPGSELSSEPGSKSLCRETRTVCGRHDSVSSEDISLKNPGFSHSAKAIAILNDSPEFLQCEDVLEDIYGECHRKKIEDIPNRYPYVTYSSKALGQRNESSNSTDVVYVPEDTARNIHCFSRPSKALTILNEPHSMEKNLKTSKNIEDRDKKAVSYDLSGRRNQNQNKELSDVHSETVNIREKTKQKKDSSLEDVKRTLDFQDDFLDDSLNDEDTSCLVEMFTDTNEDAYSSGLSLRPEDNKPFPGNYFQTFVDNQFEDLDSSEVFDTIVLDDSIESYEQNVINIPNVTMDIGYLDDDNKSTCIICTKSFEKKSDFTLHIKMHVMKPYQCKSCDECFLTVELMEAHNDVTHPMVKQVVIKKEMLKKEKNEIGTLENGTNSKTWRKVKLNEVILKNRMLEKSSGREKRKKGETKQEVLNKVKRSKKDKFKQGKIENRVRKKGTAEYEMMRDGRNEQKEKSLDILKEDVVEKLTAIDEALKKKAVKMRELKKRTMRREKIEKEGVKRETKGEEVLKKGNSDKKRSERDEFEKEREKVTLKKEGIRKVEVKNKIGGDEDLKKENSSKETSKEEENKKGVKNGSSQNEEIRRSGLKSEIEKKEELKKGKLNKKTSMKEENMEPVKKKTVNQYSNNKGITLKRKPLKPDTMKKHKLFKCDTCNKRYKKKHHLIKHKCNKQNQKDNYICEHCKKFFKLRSFYKIHLHCHSKPRNFHCDTCRATYTCKSHLLRHLIKHTGLRSFECRVCAKTYTRNDQLTVHLRTHSDVAPYLCAQCHKRFNRSDQFQLHLRRHDGVKPFQCAGCKFAFCQKSDMNRHVKKCTKHQNNK